LDHAPGLAHAAPRHLFRLREMVAALGHIFRQVLFARFQMRDDADEPLRQGVVNLAGQPRALLQDSFTPFSRCQLRTGSLQLLDEFTPVSALRHDAIEVKGEDDSRRAHDQKPPQPCVAEAWKQALKFGACQ
jgi:hypothetical protein